MISITQMVIIFYTLMFLDSIKSKFDPFLPSQAKWLEDFTAYSTAFYKRFGDMLYDYLVYICGGEMRHAHQCGKYYTNFPSGGDRDDTFKKMTKFNDESVLQSAYEAFNTSGWSGSYGGKKWKEIAETALKYPPKNPGTKWTLTGWIDHVIDLSHNTSHIFNKAIMFENNSDYKQTLDLKRYCSFDAWISEKLRRINDEKRLAFLVEGAVARGFVENVPALSSKREGRTSLESLLYFPVKWGEEEIEESMTKPAHCGDDDRREDDDDENEPTYYSQRLCNGTYWHTGKLFTLDSDWSNVIHTCSAIKSTESHYYICDENSNAHLISLCSPKCVDEQNIESNVLYKVYGEHGFVFTKLVDGVWHSTGKMPRQAELFQTFVPTSMTSHLYNIGDDLQVLIDMQSQSNGYMLSLKKGTVTAHSLYNLTHQQNACPIVPHDGTYTTISWNTAMLLSKKHAFESSMDFLGTGMHDQMKPLFGQTFTIEGGKITFADKEANECYKDYGWYLFDAMIQTSNVTKLVTPKTEGPWQIGDVVYVAKHLHNKFSGKGHHVGKYAIVTKVNENSLQLSNNPFKWGFDEIGTPEPITSAVPLPEWKPLSLYGDSPIYQSFSQYALKPVSGDTNALLGIIDITIP